MTTRRKVVHAVVRDMAQRILILKRAPSDVDPEGLWDIPGGSVEEGEHVVNALLREVREEVGVPGAITGWICRFDWPHYRNPDVTLDCNHYSVALWATLDHNRIALNAREHTHARWVSRDEMDQYTFLSAIQENMDTIFGEVKE